MNSDQEVEISVFSELQSTFAENKDSAREIRLRKIFPALRSGKNVVLDFAKIESATQSFIHALISDVIRLEGVSVLDRVSFKNCNEIVRAIIEIVVAYMQEPPKQINGNNESASTKT
jgi:hypothetical protein